ncbi:hypothetical protein C6558_27765 [Ensifer sp. NM-2]|nr:hypothetical protein C6558_27765 [Ensifer sp. NM-2]
MPVKIDKKDARGIAQVMRLGWFRTVHCNSLPSAMAMHRAACVRQRSDIPSCSSRTVIATRAGPRIPGARPRRVTISLLWLKHRF